MFLPRSNCISKSSEIPGTQELMKEKTEKAAKEPTMKDLLAMLRNLNFML